MSLAPSTQPPGSFSVELKSMNNSRTVTPRPDAPFPRTAGNAMEEDDLSNAEQRQLLPSEIGSPRK